MARKGWRRLLSSFPIPAKRRGGRGLRLVRDRGRPGLLADVTGRRSASGARGLERADDRDEAERNRLLYVALTRAESWLIVAAAGPCRTIPEKRMRPGTARSKRVCRICALTR
jgi:ATP-dependent helicase/nuclease subunit A